jgi:hypothetical protein
MTRNSSPIAERDWLTESTHFGESVALSPAMIFVELLSLRAL